MRVAEVSRQPSPHADHNSGVPAKKFLDLRFSSSSNVQDCYSIASSDMPQLRQALHNNTHVMRLSFTGVHVCDTWMSGLPEALSSSVVDVMSMCTCGACTSTSVSDECYGALARACMRNTVRRVAADDPAEVNIEWFSSLATDTPLMELAEIFSNNTHVLTVYVEDG